MSACNEHRERLGEFLVGALDARASGEVERHIEACGECSAELAEIQRLEGVLWSAEAEPAARRGRWPLAAAAAVLLAAGIAVIALALLEGGEPRLLEGEVAGLRAGPGPLPQGRALRIAARSRIVLPGTASIDASAGAELLLLADRTVRLDAGRAHFRVEEDGGGFTAETPLGTVEVPGTSFGIEVVEGIDMTSNVARGAVTAAVIVSVATGTILWRGRDGDGSPVSVEAGKVGIARSGTFEVTDPGAEARRLEDEIRASRAERDAALAGAKEVERKLSDLSAEAEALRAQASKEAEAPRKMRLAFGAHAGLEELQGADWSSLGEAAASMTKLLDELFVLEKPFEEAPQDILVRIGTHNAKLSSIALELSGKLPTHAMGNGEFTHPLVHWNILAEAMEQAEAPLSDEQLRKMGSLGEEYDAAWERLQGSYGADTLAVEKVLDELGLKKQFGDRLEAILDDRQREALGSPDLRHRSTLDLYSPVLMIIGLAETVEGRSREELRSAALDAFERAWKTALGSSSNFVDEFLDAVPLQATPPWISNAYTYDEAMAAGRAQAKLMRALLGTDGPSDETRKRMRESGYLVVPRLTER